MKTALYAILIFLVSFVLFGVTVRGVSGNPRPESIKHNLDQAAKPLELSPERGRYVLILSLAENGSFALSPVLADAADPDIGYSKGHFYIYFGPGVSILALPLYYLGKSVGLAQVGAFFTIVFFASLNVMTLFLISRHIFKLHPWAAALTAFIFGFCSPAWSYANTLYQHHITAFIILSGFYAVWQYKQQKSLSWLWMIYVWIAYGFSLFVDYPNAILVAPIIVYALIVSFNITTKEKNILAIRFRLAFIFTAFIFILINIIHGYYNHTQFGSWKKLSGGLVGIKEIKRYKLLNNPDPEAAIAKMAKTKNVVRFFQEENTIHGFSILLFSRDRGLFLYAPIFIFALLGIASKLKKLTIEIGILLSLLATHIFLYSSWGDPWGGWAFGPRYLIPSMAILSLFAGFWLNNALKRIWVSIVAFLLAGYSSAVGLAGALTTNAVPPKIEADYLKMEYNFLRNFSFLSHNNSSSYIYNEFISSFLDLPQWYACIWILILISLIVLLFILPAKERMEA